MSTVNADNIQQQNDFGWKRRAGRGCGCSKSVMKGCLPERKDVCAAKRNCHFTALAYVLVVSVKSVMISYCRKGPPLALNLLAQ
jgi:hypothetical protein